MRTHDRTVALLGATVLLPTDARHVAEDGLHAGLETVDWDREVLVPAGGS